MKGLPDLENLHILLSTVKHLNPVDIQTLRSAQSDTPKVSSLEIKQGSYFVPNP